MTYVRRCQRCGGEFEAKRPHARYCSDACRASDWKASGGEAGGERVLGHPLDEVRDRQAESEHKRRLGPLIRQAIVDRIKITGECHADDLIPLYPVGEVDLCRRLATAQFGSLCSAAEGKEPLLQEVERRKSMIPARKGGKSGVYKFTKAGRIHFGLAGSNAGASGPSAPAADTPDRSVAAELEEAQLFDADTVPMKSSSPFNPENEFA